MSDPVPFATGGAYPPRPGNAVRPLIDGEPAFRRIVEAVEAARASVWVTVAFIERDLALPGARGTFFDLLDRAAARGLDVRALFWREPELDRLLPGAWHFAGSEEDHRWLAARGALFLARWDHLPRYCHHQKSWLVDAGRPGEVAFVGGINLDHGSLVPPGHPPVGDGRAHDDIYRNVHDLYLELHGPAASDVQHNFVQRWNEASERERADGAWPDAERAGRLPFPALVSPPAGTVTVQIARTVRAERYRDATAAPGGAPFPVAGGERGVLEQYLAAVAAARHAVYVESQFLHAPEVLAGLEAALARGVEVVFLTSAIPMPEVGAARRDGRAAAVFAQLAALGRHPRFTLAGLAASCGEGRYEDVYVHAKGALVDDAWATIGSANVATRSFYADTELNASFWDAGTARALRCALLGEHLGVDTRALDARAALALFREVARANRDRRARGERLQGLAFALDPAGYAA